MLNAGDLSASQCRKVGQDARTSSQLEYVHALLNVNPNGLLESFGNNGFQVPRARTSVRRQAEHVAPLLVITTNEERELPAGLMDEVREQMQRVEEATGKGFGNAENPLLVSVRSGSALSMPGMMDTILNLGLNTSTLQGEISQTGDERFGYDSYRRFIQLFGKVALGISDELFDEEFEQVKEKAHVKEDVGLSATDLKEICERFQRLVTGGSLDTHTTGNDDIGFG